MNSPSIQPWDRLSNFLDCFVHVFPVDCTMCIRYLGYVLAALLLEFLPFWFLPWHFEDFLGPFFSKGFVHLVGVGIDPFFRFDRVGGLDELLLCPNALLTAL